MELTVKYFDELNPRELYELARIRIAVFVVEQKCPYQELDGKDLNSYHVFYREGDAILAYVRVVPPMAGCIHVSIGRVLTVRRGCGLGRKIMREGIRVARDKLAAATVEITAQTYARGFYELLGFRACSGEFEEDGIPHIKMLLEI